MQKIKSSPLSRTRSSGRSASSAGKVAENVIASVLDSKRYIYKRHYPLYMGVFGTTIYVDFYLPNVSGYPAGLIIESKWQDVAGTADEKFCYLVANAKISPCPNIFVASGGGQRRKSIQYLKDNIDGDKILHVFTIEQFISWATRELPAPTEIQTEWSDFCRATGA